MTRIAAAWALATEEARPSGRTIIRPTCRCGTQFRAGPRAAPSDCPGTGARRVGPGQALERYEEGVKLLRRCHDVSRRPSEGSSCSAAWTRKVGRSASPWTMPPYPWRRRPRSGADGDPPRGRFHPHPSEPNRMTRSGRHSCLPHSRGGQTFLSAENRRADIPVCPGGLPRQAGMPHPLEAGRNTGPSWGDKMPAHWAATRLLSAVKW